MNDKLSITNRLLINPIKNSFVFLLIGLMLSYFTLCVSKGYRTFDGISGWYLLIIRAILSLLLGIFNLLIIPFTDWNLVVLCIKNSLITFPIIGFLYGITASKNSGNPNRYNATLVLLIYIFFILMFYWNSVNEEGTISLVSFITGSSVLMSLSIVVVSIWLFANIIMRTDD